MNSFIGWIGGKKLLRKEIVKRFPENFNRYIEVFGGAAWVLFSKDKLANMDEVERNHNLLGKYKDKKHIYSELIITNY